MSKSTSYQNYLIESLSDPGEAAGYLNAALEGGDIQVFLVALHNVIKAQGGMSELAKNSDKSRTSLYKALSKKGNPYLKTTSDILSSMGMHLQIVKDVTSESRRI